MQIEYYIKNVYGNEYYYIVDGTQERLLSIITGRQKTLTIKQIDALKALGLQMKEVLPPSSVK